MAFFKKVGYITLGTFLMAFSAIEFAEQNHIVSGGAAGLGIALEGFFGKMGIYWPLYITNFFVNIPLFILALIKRGGKFLYSSLFATFLFTAFLFLGNFVPMIFPLEGDMFASAVLTGVFLGTGLSLVIKNGATTGGTEMMALLIQDRFPKFKIHIIMNIIDSVIILFGFFVFGARTTFYGIFSVFVTTYILKVLMKE